jgi:hypothetical protein
MENNNKNNDHKLQEQQAPLKNHDDAFVQVGKDGEPVFPQQDQTKEDRAEDNRTTTLDK